MVSKLICSRITLAIDPRRSGPSTNPNLFTLLHPSLPFLAIRRRTGPPFRETAAPKPGVVTGAVTCGVQQVEEGRAEGASEAVPSQKTAEEQMLEKYKKQFLESIESWESLHTDLDNFPFYVK